MLFCYTYEINRIETNGCNSCGSPVGLSSVLSVDERWQQGLCFTSLHCLYGKLHNKLVLLPGHRSFITRRQLVKSTLHYSYRQNFFIYFLFFYFIFEIISKMTGIAQKKKKKNHKYRFYCPIYINLHHVGLFVFHIFCPAMSILFLEDYILVQYFINKIRVKRWFIMKLIVNWLQYNQNYYWIVSST